MVDHARAEAPNEACGLVAVSGGVVAEVYPIKNSDASPVHYTMDSRGQLRAMLDMEDKGWELGAIYHSHTHTRAYPSATDVGMAFYPECLYVIISLAGREPDVRAYRIVDGCISEAIFSVTGNKDAVPASSPS